jgi:hypothetical protein
MSAQNYIAIDPGVGGGIAYIDTDGSVHALPMPSTVGDMRVQLEILCTGEHRSSSWRNCLSSPAR